MNYRVLIVDDEYLIREGLRKHIDWAALDMEVIGVAESAETALEMCRQHSPELLITDIRLNKKSGLDLVEDLINEDNIPAPAVILISSYESFSYAQRAVHLELVKEYVLKPIDTEKLTDILRKLKMDLDARLLEPTSADSHTRQIKQYHSVMRRLHHAGFHRHQLTQALRSHNLTEVSRLWEIVASVTSKENISANIVYQLCMNILTDLISNGIISEFPEPYDPENKISSHQSRPEILCSTLEILEQLCTASNERFAPKSRLITNCLQIIDREFTNPNFNLTSAAAQLCVTPNYLSVLFKEELGIGFMKYLLDRQMKLARLLLEDPSYKIYQISEMVGFIDEKYFSRQFKRIVGVTPKEYRNKC